MDGWPYTTFPTGWYQVESSVNLANGDVKTLHFFDRELVVYRTKRGVARAIDAFCPHLGAHIGYGGCVKGEILQCPWHGWEWDLDGKNVHIPFANRVHPRARLSEWAVREMDGLIIVWYDALGNDPSWEFPGIRVLGPVGLLRTLRGAGRTGGVAPTTTSGKHGRSLPFSFCPRDRGTRRTRRDGSSWAHLAREVPNHLRWREGQHLVYTGWPSAGTY